MAEFNQHHICFKMAWLTGESQLITLLMDIEISNDSSDN